MLVQWHLCSKINLPQDDKTKTLHLIKLKDFFKNHNNKQTKKKPQQKPKGLGVCSDWSIPLSITRPSLLNKAHGSSVHSDDMNQWEAMEWCEQTRSCQCNSCDFLTSPALSRHQNEMNSTSADDSCSQFSSPAEMPACYRDLCGGTSNFANMPYWTLPFHTGESYGI